MRSSGSYICTKKENCCRFTDPDIRKVVRYMTGSSSLLYIPQDAALAEKARAVGEFKYDPRFDIDRVCICCIKNNVENDGCAAFKILRESLETKVANLQVLDPSFVPVEVEKNPDDGKVLVTRVCNGDGRCGPVSAKHEDSFELWPELCAACAQCDKNADHGCGGTNNGNDNLAHGGIIAFFKRLFRR